MKLISKDLYLFDSRVLTHVLFWFVYYIFFSFLWAKDGALFESFELEFVLMPVRIGASYLAMYYLIPRMLLKEKFIEFLMAYGALMIIGGLGQRLASFYFHECFFLEDEVLVDIGLYFRGIVLVNSTVMLLSATKIFKYWLEEKRKNLQVSEEPLEIKAEKRFYRVLPSSINYVEGLGNYVTFYLANGKTLISYMSLKEAESLLTDSFKRIHKSFIINMDKIDSYSHENVEIHGRIIPIGKSYEL